MTHLDIDRDSRSTISGRGEWLRHERAEFDSEIFFLVKFRVHNVIQALFFGQIPRAQRYPGVCTTSVQRISRVDGRYRRQEGG